MNPLENLKRHGFTLPRTSIPGGNYISVNVRGNIAYFAIQFPISNGDYLFQGSLGEEISTNGGYKAMQLCALNVLAQINDNVGFNKIIGLNHFEAFIQSGPNWDDFPAVVDGASDLFVQILEDKGKHSRSIMGVAKLPKNFCVGLTASFTIKI